MTPYQPVIQQTLSWIEAHLEEDISPRDIERISGYSQFHFHRLFQSALQMSVMEYVRRRRLTKAAVALTTTEERILDLAYQYHFESQEAFTRAFKKQYHLPPGRYRTLFRIATQTKEDEQMDTTIKGWMLSGSHPYHYEMGIDREEVHQGKASGYLKSIAVKNPSEFATMMQQFKADTYRGKRVRLTGFVKSQDVEVFSGLWMRVDSASEDILQFDNMHNRPITGTQSWNHYGLVLDVPENSAVISFGLLLSGSGHVWVDQLRFEEVGKDVPTTHLEVDSSLADGPENLLFEEM